MPVPLRSSAVRMTVGGSSMGAGARPGRPVGVATWLLPGICASAGAAGLPLIVRGGGVGVAFGSRLTVGGMNGAGGRRRRGRPRRAWSVTVGAAARRRASRREGVGVAPRVIACGKAGGVGLWSPPCANSDGSRDTAAQPPMTSSNAPVRLTGKKRRLPESGDRSGSIVRDHRQLRRGGESVFCAHAANFLPRRKGWPPGGRRLETQDTGVGTSFSIRARGTPLPVIRRHNTLPAMTPPRSNR